MTIANGEQILPTDGFEDFADETEKEQEQYDDQINDEQPLNDDDTATADVVDPEDEEVEEEGSEEDASSPSTTDEKASEETKADEDGVKDDKVEDDDTNGDEESTGDKETEETPQEVSKRQKFERYSRSVQRRINKEVKQREHLKAENDALKERMAAIENKLSEDTQKSEANILATRIRNATAIKQQLMEDAEYDQVAQVDNDIMQMKINQAKLEERAQQQQYTQQTQAEPEKEERNAPNIPDIQKNWIQSNERFGNDQSYTAYVNSTYDALIEEGYDPEDKSLYDELNVRTGTTPVKPYTAPAQAQAPAPAPVQRKRPKAAPTPNVGQAQAKSKATSITEADKANMRNWGLDPNDKAVRKEWLNNKRKKRA